MKIKLGRRLFIFVIVLSPFSLGGAPANAATLLRPLKDNVAAMRARIELIRSAKTELLISALDFNEDVIGDGVLSEISDARARGVKVFWLIDNAVPGFLPGGGPLGVTPPVAAYLKSIGVKFKTYNQFSFLHPIKSIAMRFHDKLFIADRTRKIGGDRNIGGYYFNLGGVTALERAQSQFDDLDVYLVNEDQKGRPQPGGVPAAAAKYFLEIFNLSSHSKPISTRGSSKRAKSELNARIDHARKLIAHVFDQPDKDGVTRMDWSDAPTFTFEDDQGITFVHDVPGQKRSQAGTAEAIMGLFDRAEKSIYIVTPYLVMTSELEKHLRAARARGVAITLVTSSKRSTDMKILTAGMDRQNRLASDLGIRILEYVGDDSLHIKSYVIDGEISFVGSYNLNGRSEKRDTESGDIIKSKKFARYLMSVFAALPAEEVPRHKIVRRDVGVFDAFTRAPKFGLLNELRRACMLSLSLVFKNEE